MRNCYQSDNCGRMPADECNSAYGCTSRAGAPHASASCGYRSEAAANTGSSHVSSSCGCGSSHAGTPHASGSCGCAQRGTAYAAPINCSCFLAIANVPWQQFTNSYEPEQALKIGTMFPELDKPFLGRSVRS